MASAIPTECFTSNGGTSAKVRKSRRWGMRRGGPRCDACGADCGGWEALLAHLKKAAVPEHAYRKQILDDQRERVEEVVEDLRSPRRRAA